VSWPETQVRRFLARVRALLPGDWKGQPGTRFRETLNRISNFATKHKVRPKDLASDGIVLGKRKLEGLANKEYATALKDFADAEHRAIETELQRRSLEIKVRKEEAETRLAEVKALDPELDLLVKLRQTGVVLLTDARGNLTVLPAPDRCDLIKLARKTLVESNQVAEFATPELDQGSVAPSDTDESPGVPPPLS